MITLAVDASTYVGTVAVLSDGVLVARGEARMRGEHEERLMPAVAAVLADAAEKAGRAGQGEGAAWPRVDRIVCGAGPGSFTSLRIAGSIAKGLATGWNIPLYAVSSLALMLAAAEPALPAGCYVAALDALRGEAYVAAYSVESDGRIVSLASERRVSHDELTAYAESLDALLVGPGQALDFAPDARGVLRLAPGIFEAGPVDAGSWEPAYGRLAEAQVRWEAVHGVPLRSGGA